MSSSPPLVSDAAPVQVICGQQLISPAFTYTYPDLPAVMADTGLGIIIIVSMDCRTGADFVFDPRSAVQIYFDPLTNDKQTAAISFSVKAHSSAKLTVKVAGTKSMSVLVANSG